MSQRAKPFHDQLSTDGMRAMLDAWIAAGHDTAMPRRPDFEPTRFPHLLPHIQFHERRDDDRWFCKVSGSAVVEAYGFESSNRYVDDVIRAGKLKVRMAILDEALETGRPIYYGGSLEIVGSPWRGIYRLVLPLADAQGTARFTVSVLDFAQAPPPARSMPGVPDEERYGIAFKAIATAGDLAAARVRRAGIVAQ